MRVRGKGITVSQLQQMMLSQKTCQICGIEFGEDKINKPHIDHSHETGVTRGLLCTRCNIGIGQFEDDPNMLRLAAEYLEEYQQLKIVD